MDDNTRTPHPRDVMQYYPMVCRVAATIRARVPQSVDVGDLINVGMVALIESLRRFDSGRGVSFEVFARHRVRGAMLDNLRGEDWVPHSVRRKAQAIDHARRTLRRQTDRRPTEGEVATRMGLGLSELQTMAGAAEIRPLLSLDAPTSYDNATPLIEQVEGGADVEDEVLDTERRSLVQSAIAKLPPREAAALTMHYLQDLPLREVGARLGVTESRACQLCGQGIQRLRRRIGRVAA